MVLPLLVLLVLAIPEPAWADELTGTWRGMLSSGEQSTDSMFTISDDGFLVIEYTNNQGLTRRAELSEIGQQVQYVPEGGGVRTVEVTAIEKAPGQLAVGLRSSFERASNGYMNSTYSDEVLIFSLTAAGLETEMRVTSSSSMGDRDLSVTGGDTSIERGVLQRVE
jgi:hypothetical protein